MKADPAARRIVRPRQARSERRRKALLLAATRVFGAQGVARATVADVAAEAGVPVSAIYDYFPSKEQLLCEVPRANFEELYGSIDVLLAGIASPKARLELLYLSTMRYIVANPDWGRVFFLEIWPSRTALDHPIREAIDDYARRFVTALGRARDAKELPADADPYLGMTLLLGAMCQLVATWLLLGRPSDLVGAGRAAFRTLWAGLESMAAAPASARGADLQADRLKA